MHSNYLLYVIFINCFGELLGKNHFEAKVYNNRFKVRRLIKFKLELCKEVHLIGKLEDTRKANNTLENSLK